MTSGTGQTPTIENIENECEVMAAPLFISFGDLVNGTMGKYVFCGAWKHIIKQINFFVVSFSLFAKGLFLDSMVCRIVWRYLVGQYFSS